MSSDKLTHTDTPKPVPGYEGVKAPAVAPDEARKIIESRQLPPNIYNPNASTAAPAGAAAFASNTVPGPASIVELARALRNDIDLMHQWTQDNLDFTPLFGSQKGAVGAIVDGLGSSADIADVFVQLARQAGFSCNYMFGELELTPQQVADWLGTDPNNIFAASNLLSYGGIPNTVVFGPTRIRVSHMWVKVYNVGGQDLVFDPSFKSYTVKPTADLATIMSYNQTTFVNSAKAGSTETLDYIQNINRTNLRNNLQTHAMNLVNHIRTNNFAATTDDIIGGRNIVPWSVPVRQTSLPYQNPSVTPTEWTEIPVAYKARLRVQFDVIDVTFNSADIHTRRLTIFFNAAHQAELRLDGTLVATSNPQFGFNSVLFTATHPYPSQFADRSFFQRIVADQRYLLAQRWGGGGRADMDRHRKKQDQAVLDGLANNSEALYGETLATFFANFDGQQSRTAEIIDRFTNCTTVFHHQIGLVANTNNFPFIDMGSVVVGTGHYSQDNNKIALNNITLAMHGVALEEALFPQMTGIGGASATRMIDIGAAAGNKIFNAASANWSGTVRPQLTGWDSGVLNQIENSFINQGWRVVLPEQGNLPVGIFTGYGYDAIFPGNGGVLGFLGLFKGGGPIDTIAPGPVTVPGPGRKKPEPGGTLVDPVDAVRGDYLFERVDLSVGSQDYPYSLKFARSYNSADRLTDGPLGLGWTHNLDMTAKNTSDGFRGLGDSPIDAAVSIAQLFIAVDLLTDPARPLDKFLIASLSDQWWVDQIFSNVVNVRLPDGTVHFTKLADGSYNAPPASSATLVKNGDNTFTLRNKHQVAMNFAVTGEITSIVYPAGVTVSFSYTAGKLTSVTNGMGRTLTLNYTGNRLSSVSDGTGRSVSYVVDANKNLTQFTDANSKLSTFAYDVPGRLTQVFLPKHPATATVTNLYDSLDRVKEQRNAHNNLWQFFLAGSRSEEVDPVGNKHIKYFNRLGSVTRDINGVGQETKYDFDGRNRRVKKTMAEGNVTEWVYDSEDNVLSVTYRPKPGSPLANIVNSFTYHPTYNKVATATDGLGRTTTMSYDPPTGNLLTIQRPQVGGQTPVVSFSWNARGQMLTRVDETGIVTQFSYDGVTEKLNSVVHDFGVGRLNLTTNLGFNSRGDLTSVQDPRGNTTALQFDVLRRRTQKTDPAPLSYVTNFGYDDNNNLSTIDRQTGNPLNPWQTTTINHTLSNKRQSVVDDQGNTTSFQYDLVDRLFKVIDAELRVTEFGYDADSRLFTVKDPANNIAETRLYSNNSLLASVRDARNNLTQFSRDGFDRPDRTTHANGSFEQNQVYDANNNVLTFRTRSGATIVMTWDELNRLKSKAPSGQSVVDFSYDLAGRLLSASSPVIAGNPGTGNFQMAYDSAGRFFREQYPDGKVVSHDLDENGNIKKTIFPDLYFVERVYDQINRLTDIKLNGSPTAAAHFDYNPLSNRTQLTFDNGVTSVYGYEPDDDLSTLTHNFVGSSVAFTLGYNGAHQMNSQQVSDAQYMWHPALPGSTSYGTANSINQYTTVGGQNLTYNGNGCLTFDGVNQMSYDTENHMVTANWILGATLWRYRYDPLHRQAQKEVSPTKTRFIYNRWQRIADYDGLTDTLQSRYVYGTRLDEVLIKVSSDGTRTYYSHNHQHSVVALTNQAGAVTNRYKYSPFGESSSMVGTTHGFQGQRFDAETGFYFCKHRYQSVKLGRFLQPDPLRALANGPDLNLYTYVKNDPLNFQDPLGLVFMPNKTTIIKPVEDEDDFVNGGEAFGGLDNIHIPGGLPLPPGAGSSGQEGSAAPPKPERGGGRIYPPGFHASDPGNTGAEGGESQGESELERMLLEFQKYLAEILGLGELPGPGGDPQPPEYDYFSHDFGDRGATPVPDPMSEPGYFDPMSEPGYFDPTTEDTGPRLG